MSLDAKTVTEHLLTTYGYELDPESTVYIKMLGTIEMISKYADTLSDRYPTFSLDREEFLAALRADESLNFHHDIKSGLFVWDIASSHEILRSYLYEMIRRVKTPSHGYAGEHPGDKYIREGLGWFRSSCNDNITLGSNTPKPKWLPRHVEFFYYD